MYVAFGGSGFGLAYYLGAMHRLLEETTVRIRGAGGTSGGAICAVLLLLQVHRRRTGRGFDMQVYTQLLHLPVTTFWEPDDRRLISQFIHGALRRTLGTGTVSILELFQMTGLTVRIMCLENGKIVQLSPHNRYRYMDVTQALMASCNVPMFVRSSDEPMKDVCFEVHSVNDIFRSKRRVLRLHIAWDYRVPPRASLWHLFLWFLSYSNQLPAPEGDVLTIRGDDWPMLNHDCNQRLEFFDAGWDFMDRRVAEGF